MPHRRINKQVMTSAPPAHARAPSETIDVHAPRATRPRSGTTWRLWHVGVFLACVLSATFVLGATARGVGLSVDSMQYFSAAQSASAGRGLLTYAWEGEPTVLTHFPPAYPLMLSAAARLGCSPESFARWLNVLLFALTIVTAVAITRRLTPQSPWSAVAVAALYASAHDLVVAHSMAWTEPLYLTLTLLGCLLLTHAIERENQRLLLTAALVAALSAMVRYIGVANIATVPLAVLLWSRGTPTQRTRRALAVSVIAALPLAATLAITSLQASVSGGSGGIGNRRLGWHPLETTDVRSLVSVIARWVSPTQDATLIAAWSLGVAALFGAVMFARRRVEGRARQRAPLPLLARILLLFAAAYVLVLLLSMTLADAQTELDSRLLAPVLAVAIILGVVWLSQAAHDRFVRLTSRAIVALIFVAGISRLLPWVRDAYSHGLVLRRVENSERELIVATEQLPRTARVYSNRPYFLRVQTARMISGIPRERDPNSLLPNPRYAQQLRVMCDASEQRDTYVVMFPVRESEDPTVHAEGVIATGDVRSVAGGSVIKLRRGCRA